MQKKSLKRDFARMGKRTGGSPSGLLAFGMSRACDMLSIFSIDMF